MPERISDRSGHAQTADIDPYVSGCFRQKSFRKDRPQDSGILRKLCSPDRSRKYNSFSGILSTARNSGIRLWHRICSFGTSDQIFFKTAGITLHTFRYPGDYLAVADNSNFSALSAVLRNFAQKHADTLAIAVGKSVPLYQLGLSLNTAETTLRSLHQPLTDNICTENYAVFDDLTLEIILSSVSRKDREEFFVKTIYRLSPDEKDLLRTYFSLEMSLADTAEKLFLHKNTLQYKLNHIYKNVVSIPGNSRTLFCCIWHWSWNEPAISLSFHMKSKLLLQWDLPRFNPLDLHKALLRKALYHLLDFFSGSL